MIVGIFTVIMLIGAIVVDLGLWLSERRGAQKDADATSLAGVQPYLDDLTNTSGAFSDAIDWAVKNEVDPGEIDAASTSDCSEGNSCIQVGIGNCYGDGSDSAMPWVEAKIRHTSRSLFGGFFGVLPPDIGAVARACVGSPRGFTDNNPFAQQVGYDDEGRPLSDCMEPDPDDPSRTRPIYGAVCILKTSANANETGQYGLLTLANDACGQPSAADMRDHIRYNALGTCYVGQDVNTATGSSVGLIFQALRERLNQEGLCDERFFTGNPDYDDFNEVFSLFGADPGDPILPSPDNVFVQNDCMVTETVSGQVYTYMPRAINLLLVERFNASDAYATITGRAAYYVIGCFHRDESDRIKAEIEADLNNMDAYLNRCEGAAGQHDLLGSFVQELMPPIEVGDPDPNLGLSIVLVK